MNGMKTEEMGSRKKYLVPVVVLLLCLVSLTGAAYAYSSSMTYTDNAVESSYISLDFATPDADSDIEFDKTTLAFTDDFIYSGDSKKDTVTCEVTDTVATYHLKISGDLPSNKLYVKSANLADFLDEAVGAYTLGDLFTVKVGITNVVGDADVLPTNGSAAEFDVEKGDTAKTQDVFIFFVHKETGSFVIQNNVEDDEDLDDDTYRTASEFQALIDTYSFSLNFKAQQVDP